MRRLDPAGARLEVWTVFGGTAIKVPENWLVRLTGATVFGSGFSTARAPQDGFDGPALEIRHRTVFGGVGVRAEPDDGLAMALPTT